MRRHTDLDQEIEFGGNNKVSRKTGENTIAQGGARSDGDADAYGVQHPVREARGQWWPCANLPEYVFATFAKRASLSRNMTEELALLCQALVRQAAADGEVAVQLEQLAVQSGLVRLADYLDVAVRLLLRGSSTM